MAAYDNLNREIVDKIETVRDGIQNYQVGIMGGQPTSILLFFYRPAILLGARGCERLFSYHHRWSCLGSRLLGKERSSMKSYPGL